MAYKQNFGPSRVSGYNKTKQVAGQSSLFRLGSSPLNHDMDFDHEHEDGKDRYSRQVPVKPGTKRQNRKSRNILAAQLTKDANTRDADGDALNTQGYMKGGSGGKFKVGGRNLLEVKTGTRGGGSGSRDSYTSKQYPDVKEKDVRRQLKKTGSVNIVDGKVSSGTTQTKTTYGYTSRDNRKKASDAKRAQDKANLAKRREAQAKEREARVRQYDAARTLKAAEIVKRRKEYATNKNKK
tara:strand:+ start:6643 stop:7356 length:714 start_codon:yes stop_codon:yes gene_type:complete